MKDYIIIDKYNPELIISDDPVFIVGYPRSGTTVIQAKLMTHTALYSFPETHFFNIVWNQAQFKENENLNEAALNSALAAFKGFAGFQIKGNLKDHLEILVNKGSLKPKDLFDIISLALVNHYYPHANGHVRIIEKTPCHANAVARIAKLYPKAKFIWVIRWPIDVIQSAKRNLLPQKNMEYHAIFEEWLNLNKTMHAFYKNNLDRVYKIYFEQFTSQSHKITENMIIFLKENYIKGSESLSDNINKIAMSWEKWKINDIKEVKRIRQTWQVKNNYELSLNIVNKLKQYPFLYPVKNYQIANLLQIKIKAILNSIDTAINISFLKNKKGA